jgi:hypothetical protein
MMECSSISELPRGHSMRKIESTTKLILVLACLAIIVVPSVRGDDIGDNTPEARRRWLDNNIDQRLEKVEDMLFKVLGPERYQQLKIEVEHEAFMRRLRLRLWLEFPAEQDSQSEENTGCMAKWFGKTCGQNESKTCVFLAIKYGMKDQKPFHELSLTGKIDGKPIPHDNAGPFIKAELKVPTNLVDLDFEHIYGVDQILNEYAGEAEKPIESSVVSQLCKKN